MIAAFLRDRQVTRTDDLVPYPVRVGRVIEPFLAVLGMGVLRSVERLGGKAQQAVPERLRRLGSGFEALPRLRQVVVAL